MKESQEKRLTEYLRSGGKITIMEAFQFFGITSLHRRLTDIRNKGIDVKDEWIKLDSGKRVKRYFL